MTPGTTLPALCVPPELAARIPSAWKVRRGETKWVLKQACGPQLPAAILSRPKQGFEIPVDAWMRDYLAARRVLGVQVRLNAGLPNRELMDVPANRYVLATLFRRLRPTVVIGTAGRTPAASPDHHQAHLLIEAARFYAQLTKWDDRFAGTPPYRVPHLVYAPFPSDAEVRHWQGSIIIDITDTFEQKLESIRCYESQFDAVRFEKVRHFVGAYNATLGGRCGFNYGELFTLPHPVGGNDLFTVVTGSKGPAVAVVLPER